MSQEQPKHFQTAATYNINSSKKVCLHKWGWIWSIPVFFFVLLTFWIYAQLLVPPVFDSYSPDPLIPYTFPLSINCIITTLRLGYHLQVTRGWLKQVYRD